jgi:hypothetical protein
MSTPAQTPKPLETASARAPGPARAAERPLLLIDIDGVVSLFGFPPHEQPPEGSFHWIDGIPHFLSAAAARHLLALGEIFELVWCSGWEERANEYLPHLLGLPPYLPFLRFERGRAGAARGIGTGTATQGHWKLAAIDAYTGTRAVAWIDDCLDAACHAWATARMAPTLLVQTVSAQGLTEFHARELRAWASELTPERPSTQRLPGAGVLRE